jgi:hypothetical protein
MLPEPFSHTFQIRRALLREDELPHESKRKTAVVKKNDTLHVLLSTLITSSSGDNL